MSSFVYYPASDGADLSSSAGQNSGGSVSYPNLYSTISEGTASPDDTSYIKGQLNGTFQFGLGAAPSDLATVTAVTISVRLCSSGTKTPVMHWSACQLFQSDGATALVASQTISDTSTLTTYSFSPSISGATSYAAWNNAILQLTMNSGTNLGAKLSAAQVSITYTPASGPLFRRVLDMIRVGSRRIAA